MWRQCSREEEAFRKKGREEVRGEHWRLRQEAHRSLRTADRSRHTADKRLVCVSQHPVRVELQTSGSRIQTTQSSEEHTALILKLRQQMVWDLSIRSTRSPVCQTEAAQKLVHIWSLNDATDRRWHHMWMFWSPWMQEASHTVESKSLLDSMVLTSC